MARAVVLGADGFIGKHLVRALADSHQVIAFDRFSNYSQSDHHEFAQNKNITIVPGDFLNSDEFSSLLQHGDYVFHLVSTTNPANTSNNPFIDIDTNLRGSVALFEKCVEQKVAKVIFLSSGGTVYGDVESEAITEDSLPQPRSPYGIGKLSIEHYLRYFNVAHGLDYVVYRAANPYGPGQNIHGKQGVIPIFMHKYLTKQPITIYGDGNMVRDYFYIADAIAMIASSAFQKNNHAEYNLGSGHGVSLNELVVAIEACVGYAVDKEYIPAPSTFLKTSVLDIQRFNAEFGAINPTSLTEGLQRTWEYVKTVGA